MHPVGRFSQPSVNANARRSLSTGCAASVAEPPAWLHLHPPLACDSDCRTTIYRPRSSHSSEDEETEESSNEIKVPIVEVVQVEEKTKPSPTRNPILDAIHLDRVCYPAWYYANLRPNNSSGSEYHDTTAGMGPIPLKRIRKRKALPPPVESVSLPVVLWDAPPESEIFSPGWKEMTMPQSASDDGIWDDVKSFHDDRMNQDQDAEDFFGFGQPANPFEDPKFQLAFASMAMAEFERLMETVTFPHLQEQDGRDRSGYIVDLDQYMDSIFTEGYRRSLENTLREMPVNDAEGEYDDCNYSLLSGLFSAGKEEPPVYVPPEGKTVDGSGQTQSRFF